MKFPKVKPIQRFRGLARVVAAFFILKKHASKLSKQQKEGKLVVMKQDIILNSNVCEIWIMKCIRPILISVSLYNDRY